MKPRKRKDRGVFDWIENTMGILYGIVGISSF